MGQETKTPDSAPDLTRFADGIVYCDGGREVTRRGVSWYHRDDQMICMTETYKFWPGGMPESVFPGVQCTSPVQEPSEGSTEGGAGAAYWGVLVPRPRWFSRHTSYLRSRSGFADMPNTRVL